MDTETLTRSKLVTREIKEELNYTKFGTNNVAVHVHLNIFGVDPVKKDTYGVMSQTNFSEMMKSISKDKGDLVYTNNLTEYNESYSWLIVSNKDRAKFSQFPESEDIGAHHIGRSFALKCMYDHAESLGDDDTKKAHALKVYNNVLKKNGSNLIHCKHYDHTFRDINGKLIPVPKYIDYGIRSSKYLMKPVVDYLRTLPFIKMVPSTHSYNMPSTKYPEIRSIPYYNAEFEGETEIYMWVSFNQKEYEKIIKNKIASYELINFLEETKKIDLAEFKIKENDYD